MGPSFRIGGGLWIGRLEFGLPRPVSSTKSWAIRRLVVGNWTFGGETRYVISKWSTGFIVKSVLSVGGTNDNDGDGWVL
jgi:hypothetical protein